MFSKYLGNPYLLSLFSSILITLYVYIDWKLNNFEINNFDFLKIIRIFIISFLIMFILLPYYYIPKRIYKEIINVGPAPF